MIITPFRLTRTLDCVTRSISRISSLVVDWPGWLYIMESCSMVSDLTTWFFCIIFCLSAFVFSFCRSLLLQKVVKDKRGRREGKKGNRILKWAKQYLCGCITKKWHFLLCFYALFARLNVKYHFFISRHMQTNHYFSVFLSLYVVFRNSTPGDFAYIWLSERVGMIKIKLKIKFQWTRIHF